MERLGHDLALLYFDLDDFKRINDWLGHQAGNEVLRRFASTLRQNKRQEDIAARFGGEEFVLQLPQASKTDALLIGERIRHQANKVPLAINGNMVKLSVSCGLAVYPYD